MLLSRAECRNWPGADGSISPRGHHSNPALRFTIRLTFRLQIRPQGEPITRNEQSRRSEQVALDHAGRFPAEDLLVTLLSNDPFP